MELSDNRVSIPFPPFSQTSKLKIFSFSILEEQPATIPFSGGAEVHLVRVIATADQAPSLGVMGVIGLGSPPAEHLVFYV